MKRKILATILTVMLTVALTVGTLAATGAVQITATLDSGVTIQFNGQTQSFTDANGNPVYPVMYNNTTYLPVRAVSDMVGLSVDWNANTRTVLLSGTQSQQNPPPATKTKLSETREMLSHRYRKLDSNWADNFGNKYTHGVKLESGGSDHGYVEFALNGEYRMLTAAAAINLTQEGSFQFRIYSLSDAGSKLLYTSPEMDRFTRPFDITVDVTGVDILRIERFDGSYANGEIALGNAFVE
jgi:hypothetical protein